MNRRSALKFLAALFSFLLWPADNKAFAGGAAVEHPIDHPKEYTKHKRCANCGMDRNKWARTRHSFHSDKGEFHTCSIHCVAVLSIKLRTEARGVRVAEYFYPENMVGADKAFYVIGSRAPGTMTGTSKIAFSSRNAAESFAREQGGRQAGFKEAMDEAMKEIKRHMKH